MIRRTFRAAVSKLGDRQVKATISTGQRARDGHVLVPEGARLDNFKRNRRGYISLWVFGVLFVISLLANFVANDQPLYIRYDGKSYFPVFVTYPETTFGGDFQTVTRKHSKNLVLNDVLAVAIDRSRAERQGRESDSGWASAAEKAANP